MWTTVEAWPRMHVIRSIGMVRVSFFFQNKNFSSDGGRRDDKNWQSHVSICKREYNEKKNIHTVHVRKFDDYICNHFIKLKEYSLGFGYSSLKLCSKSNLYNFVS